MRAPSGSARRKNRRVARRASTYRSRIPAYDGPDAQYPDRYSYVRLRVRRLLAVAVNATVLFRLFVGSRAV
jgi:hypothetical protein